MAETASLAPAWDAPRPKDPERGLVAGVPVAVSTLDDAVVWFLDWCSARRGGISIRLINAYVVVSAHRDPAYLRLMRERGVSFPDGTPVALALRTLGGRSAARRVRGPSFFMNAVEQGEPLGIRHYFVGTTDRTLTALEQALSSRFPDVAVAGHHAPPFADVDDEMVEQCRAQIAGAGADCVWVALGTPKQDHLAERLSQVLDIPCVAVGAAFDFAAGTKVEAPRILQLVGAEWLFRLLSEPRRLWRRYLIGNIVFLYLAVRYRR